MMMMMSTRLAAFTAAALALASTAAEAAASSFSVVEGEEEFTFKYSTTEPDATNWIGLYHADAGPVDETYPGSPSLAWDYSPGTEGTVFVSASSLQPGDYSAYFLAGDGYAWLADPITVTLPAGPISFPVDQITLHNARVGDEFEARLGGLVMGGGDSGVSFTKTSGSEWASVSADGTLSGKPDTSGESTVIVRAESADGSSATEELEVTVPVVGAGQPLVSELRVLSYNLWHGGTQVSGYHAKQVAFLAQQNVDVVGLQESTPDAHGARLAEALGWHVWQSDSSIAVISRYPIAEEHGYVNASGGVRISLDDGAEQQQQQQVNFWVVHLGYTPYGPYDFCFDGMTVDEVLVREAESGRTGQMRDTLAAMESQIAGAGAGDVPVLLVGDTNAPSHLDWVESLRNKNCGYADVPWPTSVQPTDAGLTDSFREAHPDPAAEQGITWSPVYPRHEGSTGRAEPQDRIDFIYYAGNLGVMESRELYVGEPKPAPDVGENEWTSDHAAVLSVFSLL